VVNLLGTMEPAVRLREFAKAFPDPQQKAKAPTRAQVDEMLKERAELTKMQRTVNMDLVRHPYLAKILEQSNQDARVVERWDLAMRIAAK